MMKKLLKLDQIRVQSFVTELNNKNQIKGGADDDSKMTGFDDTDPTKTSSSETEVIMTCPASSILRC